MGMARQGTKQMSWRRIIIRYGGHWENLNYVGGDEDVLPVCSTGVMYSSLLESIESMVQYDLNQESYILYSLDGNGTRVVKFKLKNDRDLTYLMDTNADPVIYVVLKPNPNVHFQGSNAGINTNFTQFVGNSRYGGGLPFFGQTGPSFLSQSGGSRQPRPHERNFGVSNEEYVARLGEQDPPLQVNDEQGADSDVYTTYQGSCDVGGVEGRRKDQSFMDYCGFSGSQSGDPNQWTLPTNVMEKKCEPPKPHKQVGRPKGKRLPSGAESSTRMKYQVFGRCKCDEPNKVRCSNASQAIPTELKKRKCSVCGATDHTRRRCSIYIAREVTSDRPDLNELTPKDC